VAPSRSDISASLWPSVCSPPSYSTASYVTHTHTHTLGRFHNQLIAREDSEGGSCQTPAGLSISVIPCYPRLILPPCCYYHNNGLVLGLFVPSHFPSIFHLPSSILNTSYLPHHKNDIKTKKNHRKPTTARVVGGGISLSQIRLTSEAKTKRKNQCQKNSNQTFFLCERKSSESCRVSSSPSPSLPFPFHAFSSPPFDKKASLSILAFSSTFVQSGDSRAHKFSRIRRVAQKLHHDGFCIFLVLSSLSYRYALLEGFTTLAVPVRWQRTLGTLCDVEGHRATV